MKGGVVRVYKRNKRGENNEESRAERRSSEGW